MKIKYQQCTSQAKTVAKKRKFKYMWWINNQLIFEKYEIVYVLFAEQSVLKATELCLEPIIGTPLFT